MDRKIICPVCGSENITKKKNIRVLKSNYNDITVTRNIIEYKCNNCGETGDFNNENILLLTKAGYELKTKETQYLIKKIEKSKLSFAGIERSLELPQRTLTKWKNGLSKPTAAGHALIRIINAFPWLIYAADEKYEENFCKILVHSIDKYNLFTEAMLCGGGGFTIEDENSIFSFYTKNTTIMVENKPIAFASI